LPAHDPVVRHRGAPSTRRRPRAAPSEPRGDRSSLIEKGTTGSGRDPRHSFDPSAPEPSVPGRFLPVGGSSPVPAHRRPTGSRPPPRCPRRG